MPIDPRLIETMICPSCGGKVRSLDGDDGLQCVECLRRYPIRRGIQVLTVESADVPDPAVEAVSTSIAGNERRDP